MVLQQLPRWSVLIACFVASGNLLAEARQKGQMNYNGQENINLSPEEFFLKNFMFPDFPMFEPMRPGRSAAQRPGGTMGSINPQPFSFIQISKPFPAPAPPTEQKPAQVPEQKSKIEWTAPEELNHVKTIENLPNQNQPQLFFPPENDKMIGNNNNWQRPEENEIKVDGKSDTSAKSAVKMLVEEANQAAQQNTISSKSQVGPEPVVAKEREFVELAVDNGPKEKAAKLSQAQEPRPLVTDKNKNVGKPTEIEFTIDFDMDMPNPDDQAKASSKPMEAGLPKVTPPTTTLSNPTKAPITPPSAKLGPNSKGFNFNGGKALTSLLLPTILDMLIPFRQMHSGHHPNKPRQMEMQPVITVERVRPLEETKKSDASLPSGSRDKCSGVRCNTPPPLEDNCVIQMLPINIKSPIGERREWSPFSQVTDCCPLWLCTKSDGSFSIHYGLEGSRKRHEEILDKMQAKEDYLTAKATVPTSRPSSYKEIRSSLKKTKSRNKSILDFIASLPMSSSHEVQSNNNQRMEDSPFISFPPEPSSSFQSPWIEISGPKEPQPQQFIDMDDHFMQDLFPVNFLSKAHLPMPKNVHHGMDFQSPSIIAISNRKSSSADQMPFFFPDFSIQRKMKKDRESFGAPSLISF